MTGDPRAERSALNEYLRASGAVTSDNVAIAMATMPRELFVPEESRDAAYVDDAVVLKRDRNGAPVSSISQPTIVATMLELLEVRPCDHVLEVGAGSGYNAALLALLVGERSAVVTVEIEADLAAKARSVLRSLAIENVDVVIGDGYDGHPPGAPYARIMVTTGAPELAPQWGRQLAGNGRLVVPLIGEDGIGDIVAFVKRDGHLLRDGASPCGFLPMRREATSA